MRLSFKSCFALAAGALYAVSAASATTITFTGSGFQTPTLLTTYVSPTAPPFTVSGTGTSGTGGINGGFIQNGGGSTHPSGGQGNQAPSVSGGKSACTAVPTPCTNPNSTAGTDTLTVTQTNGGTFFFTGFDMNDQNFGATTYTVTGTLNGVTVFTATGTDNGYKPATSQLGLWATVDPFAESGSSFTITGDNGTNETTTGNHQISFTNASRTGSDGAINALTITFANPYSDINGNKSNFGLDNIVVAPTPEPSSLFLLGTGLLGLGAVGRRKLFA